MISDSSEYLNFTNSTIGKIVGSHDEKMSGFKTEYLDDYPKNVIIPSKYEEEIVVEIGMRSFMNTNIQSVFIPNTIYFIGFAAFQNCTQLEKINFERNSALTIINFTAFAKCSSLKILDIPSNVKIINAGYLRRMFLNEAMLTCISYLGDTSFENEFLVVDPNDKLKVHVKKMYTGIFGNSNVTLVKDGRTCDKSLMFPLCTFCHTRKRFEFEIYCIVLLISQ